MKNIIVIFLSVFLITTSHQAFAQSKTMDEFTVQVDGLGCPFCAYGLEKKFKEFKGIKKVKIEMETGIMSFEYPSDKVLTIEQVENQVEKAGYTPVSVAITRASGDTETSQNDQNVAQEDAPLKTIEFFVAGNCNMCKARIEKAAKNMEGVEEANWDKKTKMLSVTLTETTQQSDVEVAIATSGHDTKTAKADSETYDSLPGCCHYDRVQ